MKKIKSIKAVICMAAMLVGMMGVMTVTAAAATPDTSTSSGAIPTNGTGTVIENNTDTSVQREFFTIKTADGNVFYIVVDKEKTGDNVYLLTQVTEADLTKLAGSQTSIITGGNTASQSQTGVTAGNVTTSPGQPTVSTNKPVASGKKTQSGNIGTIVFVALAVLVVGGAGFYFKIYKPRREMGSADDLDEIEQEDKAPEADSTDDENDEDDGDE
jgi:hypothetical protein